MAKTVRPSRPPDTYRYHTQRPLNCLVLVLPLLVFFQLGTAYYGTQLLAPRDIGRLLSFFGATAAYLPALLVVGVLVFMHIAHRDPLRVQTRVLAGMVAESILWMIPLAVGAHLMGKLALQSTAAAEMTNTMLQDALLAVGAGIYEEFIFRLVLISLTLCLLVDVFELKKDTATLIAVALSAVTFSAYHFSGSDLGGASFPWGQFVFRLLAGAYLGGLYAGRGFGIAVGAHTLYDIYVLAWQSG